MLFSVSFTAAFDSITFGLWLKWVFIELFRNANSQGKLNLRVVLARSGDLLVSNDFAMAFLLITNFSLWELFLSFERFSCLACDFKDLNFFLLVLSFLLHFQQKLEIGFEWIYWSGCCNIKIKLNHENIILQSAIFMKTFAEKKEKENCFCVFFLEFFVFAPFLDVLDRGSLSTVDIHFILQLLCILHNLHQKSNFMQMIYTSTISLLPFLAYSFCNYLN